MITLSQMNSITTLGNCLEDQQSLRNPGTSQHCESFSAERRGSKQKEKHKVTKKELSQLSHDFLTFSKENRLATKHCMIASLIAQTIPYTF